MSYKTPAYPSYLSRRPTKGARWLAAQSTRKPAKVLSAVGHEDHPFWVRIKELRNAAKEDKG
jgi:hypothetical protein